MRKLTLFVMFSGAAVAWAGLMGGCNSSNGLVGAQGQAGNGGNGKVSLKTDANPNSGPGQDDAGSPTPPPPTNEVNCGSTTSDTKRMPADVLLVLDRSGSMAWSTEKDDVGCAKDPTCVTRWAALTAAVKATLDSTAGNITWGLKLFSTPGLGSCDVSGDPEVPVAASSVPLIQAQMAASGPSSNTPTAQAVVAATAYLQKVQDGNQKFILLATDGEPNCANMLQKSTPNVDGTVKAIQAAKAAGFLTYVIGIGPSVGNLDNFAQTGGTSRSYSALSPEQLTAAFATISKAVTTCTFSLATPPKDPNNIAVYLHYEATATVPAHGELVSADPANGWSFGATQQTIILNGTSCDAITTQAASSVEIMFGCPGVAPPPIL
jgi:hypothetical protein